jgi:hypothetical protein
MNVSEKKEYIQSLSEDDFRKKVIIPLLSKLGFHDPIHNHHAGEKGKDIVCKDYDPVFKKSKHIAVVVKKGDVTGSSSSSNGYFNVINQVKQAINEPYKHIYELKEIDIDQCLIIISGKFLATSLDSIYNTLKNERIDKAIREAIDIDKLVSLIDENYSEFWSELKNEKEALLSQRNFLLNNFSKLVKIIIPKQKDQEKTLKLISQAEVDFDLFPYNTTSRYIANIGYKKIEIDEIDEYYTDEIDNFYCNIKEYVFELKNNAQKILYEIDDAVVILKAILEEKNPSKIIEHCWDLKTHTNYHGTLSFGTHDLPWQDDFYSGVEEYKEKKQVLIDNDALVLYKAINKDIKFRCKAAMIDFWKKYPPEQKDAWLKCDIVFSRSKNEIVSVEVCDFNRIVNKVKDDRGGQSYEIEIVNSNASDNLSVELALNYLGFFNEKYSSLEAKADEYIWRFRKPILEKFIELLKTNETSNTTSN